VSPKNLRSEAMSGVVECPQYGLLCQGVLTWVYIVRNNGILLRLQVVSLFTL